MTRQKPNDDRRLFEFLSAAFLAVARHCRDATVAGADESAVPAAAKSKEAASEINMSLRLLDERSQPVAGAKAGLEAADLILPGGKTAKPDWHYYLETTSDASGIVHLKARLVQAAELE